MPPQSIGLRSRRSASEDGCAVTNKPSGASPVGSHVVAGPPSTVSPGNRSAASGTLFVLYASIAGACGAFSGVVGKIAVASFLAPHLAELLLRTVTTLMPGMVGVDASELTRDDDAATTAAAVAWITWYVEMALRIAFLALNAFFTGQMWRFFLKSLSLGPTPVSQIISTGTNFAVSAFAGLVCFHEEVTVTWAVGAMLVVTGLALVVMDPEAANATAPQEEGAATVQDKKQ